MMNQQIQISNDEVIAKVSQMIGREVSPIERVNIELVLLTQMAFQNVIADKQATTQILNQMQSIRR